MCNYHRPVCVGCRVDLRPEKNGVDFIEDDGTGRPYKIWSSDMWCCPGCGLSILIGFPPVARAHHFESGFTEEVKRALNDPWTVAERTPEEKRR